MRSAVHKFLPILGLRPTGDLGPFTIYTKPDRVRVAFIKAPPTKPPTERQIAQRDQFRAAAIAWKALAQADRNNWHTVCRYLSLYLHGYNLFVYWFLSHDDASIRTVERQSGIDLLP